MSSILIIEDNELSRDMLSRRLIRRGFQVCTAEDGRAAIDLLRKEPFDVAIIDVYLPLVDGPTVIMVARRELGLADLPIIAVSAGGDVARDAALAAGANIFLDKPMRLRRVIETMQRLLAP